MIEEVAEESIDGASCPKERSKAFGEMRKQHGDSPKARQIAAGTVIVGTAGDRMTAFLSGNRADASDLITASAGAEQ